MTACYHRDRQTELAELTEAVEAPSIECGKYIYSGYVYHWKDD